MNAQVIHVRTKVNVSTETTRTHVNVLWDGQDLLVKSVSNCVVEAQPQNSNATVMSVRVLSKVVETF